MKKATHCYCPECHSTSPYVWEVDETEFGLGRAVCNCGKTHVDIVGDPIELSNFVAIHKPEIQLSVSSVYPETSQLQH